MTAFALQRRLQNVGITVASLHPGTVSCNSKKQQIHPKWDSLLLFLC